MHGAGNDFVVIDGRGMGSDHSALAVRACQLYGADGFMAVGESDIGDFRLHFYTPDGARGEMCGNGARCVCRFAYENGIAGGEMAVQTDAGLILGRRLSESCYRVELNLPGVLDLHRKDQIAYVELGSPGVPHAVVEIPGMVWEDREVLRDRAVALRYDPAFPKGANVDMYTRIGEKRIRILTYERGVEDYTLACGTGSASVAVVLWASGELSDGVLTVENPGGTLTVTVSAEKDILTALTLEGPTQRLRRVTL